MSETLEIPLTNTDASFKILTSLEDVEVVLRFDWSTRMERWHLSILDTSENPILMGQVMNINNELISRFKIDGLPPGQMMLYDTEGKSQECGRDDLGQRCRLLYLTSE